MAMSPDEWCEMAEDEPADAIESLFELASEDRAAIQDRIVETFERLAEMRGISALLRVDGLNQAEAERLSATIADAWLDACREDFSMAEEYHHVLTRQDWRQITTLRLRALYRGWKDFSPEKAHKVLEYLSPEEAVVATAKSEEAAWFASCLLEPERTPLWSLGRGGVSATLLDRAVQAEMEACAAARKEERVDPEAGRALWMRTAAAEPGAALETLALLPALGPHLDTQLVHETWRRMLRQTPTAALAWRERAPAPLRAPLLQDDLLFLLQHPSGQVRSEGVAVSHQVSTPVAAVCADESGAPRAPSPSR